MPPFGPLRSPAVRQPPKRLPATERKPPSSPLLARGPGPKQGQTDKKGARSVAGAGGGGNKGPKGVGRRLRFDDDDDDDEHEGECKAEEKELSLNDSVEELVADLAPLSLSTPSTRGKAAGAKPGRGKPGTSAPLAATFPGDPLGPWVDPPQLTDRGFVKERVRGDATTMGRDLR